MLKLVSILFLHTSIPAMSGWVDLFWLSDQPTGICCFYCNILWRRSLVPKRVNPNFVVIMLYRLYRLERTCLGVFISSPINISFTVLQPNQYILQFCNGTFLGGGGEVSVGGGGGGRRACVYAYVVFPRWRTLDAEINVVFAEKWDLSKVPPVKLGVGQNNFACLTHSHESCLSDSCIPGLFCLLLQSYQSPSNTKWNIILTLIFSPLYDLHRRLVSNQLCLWVPVAGRFCVRVAGHLCVRVVGRLCVRVAGCLYVRVTGRLCVRVAGRLCVRVPCRLCVRVAGRFCVRVPCRLCVRVAGRLCVRVPCRLCVRVASRLCVPVARQYRH